MYSDMSDMEDVALEDALYPWLADGSMEDPTIEPDFDPDFDPDEDDFDNKDTTDYDNGDNDV